MLIPSSRLHAPRTEVQKYPAGRAGGLRAGRLLAVTNIPAPALYTTLGSDSLENVRFVASPSNEVQRGGELAM
jgi:hypothetical protein